MADTMPPERRRRLMQSVRQRNTSPETAVRRILHRLGYRFRLHDARLPGTPDIVFMRRRKVIFVHGCFWHRHRGCKKATTPATRTDFWADKFAKNVERDQVKEELLRSQGIESMVVWECELKAEAVLATKLASFLGPPKALKVR